MLELISIALECCYGPRIISVKDTKTRPRRVSGLYGTSGTIGRGVAELRGLRSGT